MQRDCLNHPPDARSAQTLRGIDGFVEAYLSYEAGALDILAVADADPTSCMANVYAGLLWMLLEAPQGAQRAAHYLALAENSIGGMRREHLNTQLLRSWVDDDIERALQLCDQMAVEFPRDLVVVKTQQYLEFNRGNAAGMLRAALAVAAANADVPFMHGMTAFAYEQCHLLDEAQAAAETALEMRRKEPWAQHALAHVLLTRGRIDEGALFLERMAETWTGLNSFMLTHLWWHLALFYLSQGRNEKALRLYDEHCWGVAKDYSQDQIGAVSLLARFEITGIDVGNRWQELADHLVARAEDTVQPFLTLQYLYGLARAHRPQALALLDAVRRRADSAPEFAREAWRAVALPGCEGLYAYAQGDYAGAWQRLAACVPRMSAAGGSHAQRDLFDQILLDCAVKGGRFADAQQMLELRRAAQPDSVPVNLALADQYGKLGLPQQAERARARAHAARLRHPA